MLAVGCGPVLAGSAAVIGDGRITDEALASQVSEVTSALGLEESGNISAAILNRLITQQIVMELAKKHNVSVSKEEVDSFVADQAQMAGGTERFEQALLGKGIPADQIAKAAEATLLVAKLGPVIAPGADPQEQEIATVAAAGNLARELDTRVSPRFGIWDPELLRVGPPPNDLSKPAAKPDLDLLNPAVPQ